MRNVLESHENQMRVGANDMTGLFDKPEPTAEDLEYSLDEARWIWEEAAAVMRLHGELASLYRTNSRDKRTIKLLWQQIEQREAALRLAGVYL